MAFTLLTLGHGYTAQALALRLKPQGWRVFGTTRDATSSKIAPASDVEVSVFPGGPLKVLDDATHLLISAGPDIDGDPMLRALGPRIAERASHLNWVGYLSTTGVYGDQNGDWVGEDAPLRPSTQRGQWRVAAEQAWQSIPGLPIHVFRLAGIYGPRRGPFAKLRRGTARRIIKPGQVFSRTHVDDIAQVLEASIRQPNPGAAYNVCDDEPAPPQDVIAAAAELLGMPVPPDIPIDQADMSPMARSFYSENKRVKNNRIKEELGVKLFYPDYRSGLRAILQAEQGGQT